ncbi:MAG: hypothetical protein Q8R08_01730 [bacterium]|nr:hypothetical protein [bacterium]
MLKKLGSIFLFLGIVAGSGWFILAARKDSLQDQFQTAFFDAAKGRRVEVVSEYYDALGVSGMLHALEEKDLLCHFQAHEVGKVAYKKMQDLNEAIKTCGSSCTGGYFHGALIEAFKDIVPKPDAPESHIELADLRDKMRELCSREIVIDIHREGKCFHGVGHALTFLSGYSHLDAAISYCQLLGDKPREHYCAEGAFMEYNFSDEAVPQQQSGEISHYPCDTYTEFPAACYRSKSQKLRQVLKTADKVGQECLKLDRPNRLGCFYGTGFAFSNHVRANPRFLPSLCGQGNLDDQRMCIEGAMEKPEDPRLMASVEACEYISSELKGFCLTAFNSKSYSLTKSFELYFDNTK